MGSAVSQLFAVSEGVVLAAGFVLSELRRGPRTKSELVQGSATSPATVQRALEWLRGAGAPIEFSRVALSWSLLDPEWRAPVWRLGRYGLLREREREVEPHQRRVEPVHPVLGEGMRGPHPGLGEGPAGRPGSARPVLDEVKKPAP
jgi:hypothetical protein